MSDPGPKPSVPYWHLYVDAMTASAGRRDCALTDYALKGVGPADPQWNDKMRARRGHRRVHRATRRLGRRLAREPRAAVDRRAVGALVSSRAMDGTRIEQGPGEFSFGEDQGCTETDGRKGHRSGTIGDVPCCLMTVQLHVDPAASRVTTGERPVRDS